MGQRFTFGELVLGFSTIRFEVEGDVLHVTFRMAEEFAATDLIG